MVPQPTGAHVPDPPGTHAPMGEREFTRWLTARLAEFLGRPAEDIDPRTPFAEYGLDSVAALSLYGDIEDEFALFLEPTVAWDHPTVEALARCLAEEYASRGGRPDPDAPAEV
ncbi:acyl carrier protein [Streptomyces sp. 891-h]|uniref:acyl carrier protein n=1 Tax=unclassified Streptomyces TaxID=2593676 RepID=UPI001FAB0582|nr:acyl carrier protein [Streptomyces sp. 891-h]UNZ19883.1 acyl carrier protein [Streptomyces sp. 891-h]